jgi:hypothetical protein
VGCAVRTLRPASSSGVVGARQVEEEFFELAIVSGLIYLRLFVAEEEDLAFEGIAASALFGGEFSLGVTRDEMPLPGEQAVEGGIFFGAFGGAQAGKPVGRRAQGVAVVVEQGMLGGEAAFDFVELGDLTGSREKGFEQGDLAILIEVCFRIGKRFGKELAEPGEVLFIPAAGCSDDDPICGREFGEERRAGRGGVDEGERTLERFEPKGQVAGGNVGAAQIEPGFFAVESAVADENEPELGQTVGRLGGEGLFQEVIIVGLAGGREADGDMPAIGEGASRFPKGCLAGEVGGELGFAGGAEDEDDAGAVGGKGWGQWPQKHTKNTKQPDRNRRSKAGVAASERGL